MYSSVMDSFRLGLGDPALDFIATLADRAGRRVERLSSPGDLVRWLNAAGLLDGGDELTPSASSRQLTRARALREAIYRLLDAARSNASPLEDDMELVNAWARRPVAVPQIGSEFERTSVTPNPITAALAQVARATVDLVTGPDLGRVRQCEGCSLVFVDRSRPGRRRWCSMERCGNRSKTARYFSARTAAKATKPGPGPGP